MDSYDPESGQIYKETITPNRKPTPWDHKCPAQRLAPYTPPSGGVKSLQSLAIEQLVRHANSLQPETLEDLPAPIALRVWTAIRRGGRESFHVWAVFVQAGFHERTLKHSLHVSKSPTLNVCNIFSKLSSQDCSWVVDLTIGDNHFHAAEYKEVARIMNLQKLHIHFTHPRASGNFDDRIVQAWSTRAAQESAFTHLELLSIGNAPGITENVFAHLSKFEALGGFHVCNTGIRSKKGHLKAANVHGWKHDVSQLDAYSASELELRRQYSGSGPVCQFLGQRKVRSFIMDWLQSRPTRSLSNAPRLDAMVGGFDREKRIIRGDTVLYFERDESRTTQGILPQSMEVSRPHKRRKMNEVKGADFASMLAGD